MHGTLIAVTSQRSDWSIRGFPGSVVIVPSFMSLVLQVQSQFNLFLNSGSPSTRPRRALPHAKLSGTNPEIVTL